MNKFTRLAPVLALSLALPLGAGHSAAPATLAGKWSNPKDSVIVDVAPCGPNWCGTVTWASPKAKADAAKSGTKSLVGTRLMRDFRQTGPNKWKGSIYLPKHKMSAGGTIRMAGSDTLVVDGCAFAGLVCKSQRWTRAD